MRELRREESAGHKDIGPTLSSSSYTIDKLQECISQSSGWPPS